MSGLFDLSGKVALVTGARRGIGQAIAVALAESGADIVGLGPNPMAETAASVGATGRGFVEIEADLSIEPDLAALAAEAGRRVRSRRHPGQQRGIIRRADLLDFSESDWDAVMTVDLKSLFYPLAGESRATWSNAASPAASSMSRRSWPSRAAFGCPPMPRPSMASSD
jgi:2-deoxy-D-gluconate 3-dehydrogenase